MKECADRMDAAIQRERRKRRSKFSATELLSRENLVENIRDQAHCLLEFKRSDDTIPIEETYAPMENHELFRDGVVVLKETVTTGQESRMALIGRQEEKENQLLDQIGDTVARIEQRALGIQETVETQSKLMKSLEIDIDTTQEHLETANERLKALLKDMNKSGNFCMTIFCLVLFLGLLSVFLKLM